MSKKFETPALRLLERLHDSIALFPNPEADGAKEDIERILIEELATLNDDNALLVVSNALVIEAWTLLKVRKGLSK